MEKFCNLSMRRSGQIVRLVWTHLHDDPSMGFRRGPAALEQRRCKSGRRSVRVRLSQPLLLEIFHHRKFYYSISVCKYLSFLYFYKNSGSELNLTSDVNKLLTVNRSFIVQYAVHSSRGE